MLTMTEYRNVAILRGRKNDEINVMYEYEYERSGDDEQFERMYGSRV